MVIVVHIRYNSAIHLNLCPKNLRHRGSYERKEQCEQA